MKKPMQPMFTRRGTSSHLAYEVKGIGWMTLCGTWADESRTQYRQQHKHHGHGQCKTCAHLLAIEGAASKVGARLRELNQQVTITRQMRRRVRAA